MYNDFAQEAVRRGSIGLIILYFVSARGSCTRVLYTRELEMIPTDEAATFRLRYKNTDGSSLYYYWRDRERWRIRVANHDFS